MDQVGFAILQLVQSGWFLRVRLDVAKFAVVEHGGDTEWFLAGLKPILESQVLGVMPAKLASLALDRDSRRFLGIPGLLLGDLNLLAVVLDLASWYKPRLARRR